MRFLGVGDCADLAALYLRLAEDGHEVKVFIGIPLCQDTLCGLIDRVDDWRAELDWVRRSRQRRMYPIRKCRRGTRRAAGLPAKRGVQRDRQQRLWGAA